MAHKNIQIYLTLDMPIYSYGILDTLETYA